MARLAPVSLHSDGEENFPGTPQIQRQPASPGSSEKENRDSSRTHQTSSEKRKKPTLGMNSATQPTPKSTQNKRRRLTERRESGLGSQAAHRRRLQQVNDTDYYDPDQDEGERRAVRKGLRDLTRELNDCRDEYLQAGSTGIIDTVKRADEYYKSVKQTSDATVDSRLLINAANLSYKKAAQLALGDGSAALDVDEFVTKCIGFMRGDAGNDDGAPETSTQRRRQRASGQRDDNDVEGEADEGDALDWELLGRTACFPAISRPGLSGFLLGPLSVQKRSRQFTQRRAQQERIDPSKAIRPNELKDADLDKQETANLTQLCTNILQTLKDTQDETEKKVNMELSSRPGEVSEDEIQETMEKHGIADNGGIPLFRFCINPRSFGQTVENIFYISFLIRDGFIGIEQDFDQLPTIHARKPHSLAEAREQGIQKYQAISSLDFDTFEDLIDVYDIRESLIPPRDEEDAEARRGATSFWQS
ncbi:nuclear protein [Arachnomyces sp. PD_36]|nr:nuclear protein [Arachnomyces sp. PD_36]